MRSEEWAKPTRVKNKHKVKVSTECSDFAAEESCPNKMWGRVFAVIGQCCQRGLLLRRANGARPYIYIVRSLEFVQ